MRRVIQSVFWCIAVFHCAVNTTSDARAETASQLLKQYARALTYLKSVRFNATRYSYELGGAFKSETWTTANDIEFVSYGDQWRVRLRQRGNRWYGGKLYPFALDNERVRRQNGNLYEVHRQYVPPEVLQEQSALDFAIPRDMEHMSVQVTLEDHSNESKRQRAWRETTRPIYGYLPFDNNHWLPDLMREAGATIGDKPVIIAGYETLVLSSRGPFGTHTVYIDPEFGYLPRRIVCIKAGRDRFGSNEEPLQSRGAHGDPKHRRPNAVLRAARYEVRSVSLEAADDVYFISGFETETTFMYQNGATFRERDVVAISDVSFEPMDGELALTEQIPDGKRVRIRNAPAIECVWRDGSIVKEFDGALVQSLADLSFAPETRRWGGWLLAGNIVIIVVIATIWIYQRRLGAA